MLSIHEHVEATIMAMCKKNEKTDILVAYMCGRLLKAKRVRGQGGCLLVSLL